MANQLLDAMQAAMKAAMKAKDKNKLTTLRMLLADIKRHEIDNQVTIDDAVITSLLDKLSKQRRDSIKQFSAAGRTDLVEKEQAELKVISEFLPEPYTEAELKDLIQAAVVKTGASEIKHTGQIMAELQPQITGRADKALVAQLVRQALTS